MKYREQEQEQEQAGAGWALAGFIFGVFGWLIALATDKGDGRANKAMAGCLVWVVIIVFFVLAGAS